MLLLKFITALVFSCALLVDSSLGTWSHSHCHDYIVVGGGVGGSVFARRAAEDENTVLILEKGGWTSSGEFDLPSVENGFITGDTRIPGQSAWVSSANPDLISIVHSTPQANVYGSTTSAGLGKVLGGGSSVNGMMYTRAALSEYDTDWPENWNSEVMGKAYKLVEDASFITDSDEVRGLGGPLTLERNLVQSPITSAFGQAAPAFGINILEDMNAVDDKEGFQLVEIPRKNGQRQDAYTAYIASLPDEIRNRIDVQVRATVTKVKIRRISRKAKGVFAMIDGHEEYFCAREGVVLAAGAVETPIILERSGIGNKDRLQSLGINPVLINDHVGEHLQDHLLGFAIFMVAQTPHDIFTNQTFLTQQAQQYEDSQTGLFADSGVNAVIFSKENGADHANFEAQFLEKTTGSGGPGVNILTYSCQCVSISSRGSVHFSGNDEDPYILDPNYASDDAELEALAGGIQRLRRILASTRLAFGEILPNGTVFVSSPENPTGWDPNLRLTADEQRQQHAAFAAAGRPFSTYHFTGSAALGKVVNPESLQVFGTRPFSFFGHREVEVRGLHVVDASLFSRIPRVNTMAPTYAAAEYASSLILGTDVFDDCF